MSHCLGAERHHLDPKKTICSQDDVPELRMGRAAGELQERAQTGGAAGRGRRRSKLPAEQGVGCGSQPQDPGTMT